METVLPTPDHSQQDETVENGSSSPAQSTQQTLPNPPRVVVHVEDSACPHLVEYLANDTAKNALIKKYKQAVSWAASARADNGHAVKKRKAR